MRTSFEIATAGRAWRAQRLDHSTDAPECKGVKRRVICQHRPCSTRESARSCPKQTQDEEDDFQEAGSEHFVEQIPDAEANQDRRGNQKYDAVILAEVLVQVIFGPVLRRVCVRE
ncbi:MAG TPA: hypothetical protein VEV17_19095 [Bryobacteraceae bacterium]|nr:hypothetical protein [Bryobacteraceae bacterium]